MQQTSLFGFQTDASKLMLKGGISIPIQYGVKYKHPASKFPQFGLTKWVFRFSKQIPSVSQHANPLHMKSLKLHNVKWKAQTNSQVQRSFKCHPSIKETFNEISKTAK